MERNTDNRWISLLVAAAGAGLIALGIGNWQIPAGAQYGPGPGRTFTPPTFTPPPVFAPPVQPIDVTHTTDEMRSMSLGPPVVILNTNALIGVGECEVFPNPEELQGSLDFLMVIPQDTNTETKRHSPYVVELTHGTVLASVKRPSQVGIVLTSLGDIAFSANSDAFVSLQDNVLRIRNADGMGQTIKIRIHQGPLAGRSFSIQPGYEMVLANHKMNRNDLRPDDGIARRSFQLFAGGLVAVSQYSVESELQHSALVANLKAKEGTDPKSKRILSDMSKMAAVLNQVNGPQSFQQ